MSNYTNDEYDLTEGEQRFVQAMLQENGCGANTPDELLGDNMACMGLQDMMQCFPNLTKKQIGGFFSSLQVKNVLTFEPRLPYEYDLYWVDDGYLESLPLNLRFEDEL